MKLKPKTKQAISSLYKPKQTPSNLNYNAKILILSYVLINPQHNVLN